MKSKNSEHYTQKYFDWQKEYGAFGGWANLSKFTSYISPEDTVLDFGCGGGYLLHNINCKSKIGVEINPSASEIAKSLGIRVFEDIDLIENDSIDIIISDNALEHTLHPYEVLKKLYTKLKTGGKIIFVVPCESISYKYTPNDINQHIFSWSPMCIGNLFTHTGFNVIESKKYIHKWPPKFYLIAKYGGRTIFDLTCRIYGTLNRKWFQVRVVAEKI